MNEQEIRDMLTAALISVASTALILKIAQQTVYRWVDDGILDGVVVTRPGAVRSTYRVKSSSVRKLLGIEDE